MLLMTCVTADNKRDWISSSEGYGFHFQRSALKGKKEIITAYISIIYIWPSAKFLGIKKKVIHKVHTP